MVQWPLGLGVAGHLARSASFTHFSTENLVVTLYVPRSSIFAGPLVALYPRCDVAMETSKFSPHKTTRVFHSLFFKFSHLRRSTQTDEARALATTLYQKASLPSTLERFVALCCAQVTAIIWVCSRMRSALSKYRGKAVLCHSRGNVKYQAIPCMKLDPGIERVQGMLKQAQASLIPPRPAGRKLSRRL